MPEEVGINSKHFMQEKTEVQRGSVTCPGPQLNYSLRAESEAPGVLTPGPASPASGRALRPEAQHTAVSQSYSCHPLPRPLIL